MRPRRDYLWLESVRDVIEWELDEVLDINGWDLRKAEQCFSVKSAMYHYYGTAKSNFVEFLQGEDVKYKKYFYVIRPLLACRWIEEKECPAAASLWRQRRFGYFLNKFIA